MNLKFWILLFSITWSGHSFSQTQNVGIGTNNPNRAKLVVNGAVGSTAALFGGETTGVSIQSNFPSIGFNEYFSNAHRYIAGGFGAVQFFDPNLGYMAFDIFPPGVANAVANNSRRSLALTALGDVIVGTGTSRLSINSNPRTAGKYNAALQIYQSVESNNVGITLTDMFDAQTWKIFSRNFNDGGLLVLGLNNSEVGFFDAAGNYVTMSDRRLKNDIQPLPSVLGQVMRLQPVHYKMKHNNPAGKTSIGFIAQEVKELFPALVQQLPDTMQTAGEGHLHAVNYTGFSVLAIKAIQELTTEHERMQARITALEADLMVALAKHQELITQLQQSVNKNVVIK